MNTLCEDPKIRDLKENISALAKEKRTMKDAVDLLNEKIEVQQAEIEALQKQAETEDHELAWQRLEYATEQHARVLVENADLRAEIEALKKEIEAFTASESYMREKYKNAVEEIEALKKENAELKWVLQQIVDRVQGLQPIILAALQTDAAMKEEK